MNTINTLHGKKTAVYFVAYKNWRGEWVVDGGKTKTGQPVKTYKSEKTAKNRAGVLAKTVAENGRTAVQKVYL